MDFNDLMVLVYEGVIIGQRLYGLVYIGIYLILLVLENNNFIIDDMRVLGVCFVFLYLMGIYQFRRDSGW